MLSSRHPWSEPVCADAWPKALPPVGAVPCAKHAHCRQNFQGAPQWAHRVTVASALQSVGRVDHCCRGTL
eukprot:scaffold21129_cov21-Tisochrysis_lutea.AAC.1